MEKGSIQGLPETMLKTLFARAASFWQINAWFHDPKTGKTVSRLDDHFSKAGKHAMTPTGVTAGTPLPDSVGDELCKSEEKGLDLRQKRGIIICKKGLTISPSNKRYGGMNRWTGRFQRF